MISLSDFLRQLMSYPMLLITVILTLSVIFVNGWMGVPFDVASCIATRSLSPGKAILMAVVFNFLGVLVMTEVNSAVARTIFKMVDFQGDSKVALVALCAALFAVVAWSAAAWIFGIPTSEGHALIAGISGASVALQGGFSGINWTEWIKVVYGLFFAAIGGFVTGFAVVRITGYIFRNVERKRTTSFFQKAQIAGAASMSFMHGAQDGQKFMGVFMLGIFLVNGAGSSTSFSIPIWLMIICSFVMAIGTSVGGYKIIKTVGLKIVDLEPYQGFSADAAAAASLLFFSMAGLPVSTTHTKTTSIMGAGVARRLTSVNWNIAKDMATAWILTFPGCGMVGYLITYLFLNIFK